MDAPPKELAEKIRKKLRQALRQAGFEPVDGEVKVTRGGGTYKRSDTKVWVRKSANSNTQNKRSHPTRDHNSKRLEEQTLKFIDSISKKFGWDWPAPYIIMNSEISTDAGNLTQTIQRILDSQGYVIEKERD